MDATDMQRLSSHMLLFLASQKDFDCSAIIKANHIQQGMVQLNFCKQSFETALAQ